MSRLSDNVENALNETRMLILGAHVLLGFEYQSAFQTGFERLAPQARDLKLVSLLLMLAAVGLLIAPSTYHRLVEAGNDSRRLVSYTNRIASLALLPFAIAIGIDVYVATTGVMGEIAALVAGLGGALSALVLWYGLEWIVRLRTEAMSPASLQMREALGAVQEEQDMAERTALSTRIKQVLTEARVVIPGAQALLGFQFIAMLTDAFDKLPKSVQVVHLASLMLIALCVVLLMAPAAFHRIVERGEDSERLHTFSSAMVLGALVPLALGITGDFYVVLELVLKSTPLAIVLSAIALVLLLGLWFALPLGVRRAHASTWSPPSVHDQMSDGARPELISRH